MGNARAQYMLGIIYAEGLTGEKDIRKAKGYFRIAAKNKCTGFDVGPNVALGCLELEDGNTKDALKLFDNGLAQSLERHDLLARKNSLKHIVLSLAHHGHLETLEKYMISLAGLEGSLPKKEVLDIAEVNLQVGWVFSLKSNETRGDVKIRTELKEAIWYFSQALRLFKKCLKGENHEHIARTLDALGSAEVKMSGVTWTHRPTYRRYKVGGADKCECAYNIYRNLLGEHHETTKEIRKYVTEIALQIEREGL